MKNYSIYIVKTKENAHMITMTTTEMGKWELQHIVFIYRPMLYVTTKN